MNIIFSTLLKDKSVKKLAKCIENKDRVQINGLADTLKAAVFAAIFKNKSIIIVTHDQHAQNSWLEDLQYLLPNMPIRILPELDFFEVNAAVKSLNLYAERINILDKLIRNEQFIILSTASAAVNPVVSPEIFTKSQLQIKVGDTVDREQLISKLVDFGYQRDGEVDSIGHFAIRGGIIDIFPVNSNDPVRLEFFDDIIESIRLFDLGNKRSVEKISDVVILPVTLIDNENDSASIFDYLSDGLAVFDEPKQIEDNIQRLIDENSDANIITFENLIDGNGKIFVSSGSSVLTPAIFKDYFISINFDSSSLLMNSQIKNWVGSKLSRKHSKIIAKPKKDALDFFSDVDVGDYVVHVNHGIGKFLGVVSMEVGGSIRDYVNIQYYGEDKVYLPTDQLDSIHKYISIGDSAPRLSRLNSADWSRAKSKAKAAVEDIAEKLIDIYARRGDADGFAFAADDALQVEFEDACEFELTADQAKTLEEVKSDMEADKPMDRLICGDVGFGKTEIAIRAAFKAAMNGKQVAVLVPTTVLAYQHYLTFQKRFENFLPSVDLLSRFRSSSEQADVIKRLKAGHLDILIGTHSILNSNKVVFKDLGLLIIDEEQRFGVKQKEKFRDLASGVDVLSLSATPIPRSLHMSLVGARDLSVIETPPAERVPVQTYVVESDDGIIRDAIKRELNRGGQIFFVYNRIETIDLMSKHLQDLVPEAKIMTAHGQMASELLEQIMMDFYNGAFDILLTTSIIENGLDISNANTLIVYNSDYFGLSQLYQLRGRVGRSSRLAFAYFMFRRDKILSEAAEKRLQAIKDFAQLGSSFNIAMRDLQIRGAGNLLGAQQHGHIAGVGFAMYSQLLQNAIAKLRSNKSETSNDVEVKSADTSEVSAPRLNFNVDAFFDDKFIPESHTKFLFYQRLASLDKIDEINDFSEELKDRFGTLPINARNLVNLAIIKSYAKLMKIISISDTDSQIIFQFNRDSKLKITALHELNNKFKKDLSFEPRNYIIKFKKSPALKADILTKVIDILKILSD